MFKVILCYIESSRAVGATWKHHCHPGKLGNNSDSFFLSFPVSFLFLVRKIVLHRNSYYVQISEEFLSTMARQNREKQAILASGHVSWAGSLVIGLGTAGGKEERTTVLLKSLCMEGVGPVGHGDFGATPLKLRWDLRDAAAPCGLCWLIGFIVS